MIHVVAIAAESFPPLAALRQQSDVELAVGDHAASLRNAIATADVIVLAPRYGNVLREIWPAAKRVRWIHALGAGVETFPFDLLRKSDVVVTNSRGLYADALAEFAIAAMLWFAKDLRRLVRNQTSRLWEPYLVHRLEGKHCRHHRVWGDREGGGAEGRSPRDEDRHGQPSRRRSG